MKRSIYIIICSIFFSLSVSAQGFDPVLTGLICDYTSKAKKQYETQIGKISGIGGQHVYTVEQEKALYDLHKELNDYLSTFREYIVFAAEGYGFYLEIQRLLDNMTELSKQIQKAPTNAVAVTLCDRRKIYPELLTKSLSIVNTIKQVCMKNKQGEQASKMTQEERIQMLYSIRPKLYEFNKELRRLAIYVKYTSMSDAWRMMTHQPYERDKGAAAREALAAWRASSRQPMHSGNIWSDITNN